MPSSEPCLLAALGVDMDQFHRLLPPLSAAGASASAVSRSRFWPPQEACGAVAEELKEALLRTTMELESTRAAAHEEFLRKESQALHLTRLLESVARERDEARHALLLLLLHPDSASLQNSQPEAPGNFAEAAAAEDADESGNANGAPLSLPALEEVEAAAARKGLPEKGRLVEAVMGAGPLLQTLLLAGPLPQWRHPPADLRSSDIPPVAITMCSAPKRQGRGMEALPPSPTSLWNSSSSSSSLESGSSKFQTVAF